MSGLRSFALLAGILAAASAQGQSGIDGTIRNGTTGGPGRAERINLMQMVSGPNTIATLNDVEGSFHFDLKAPGPYLLQAQYQGATYVAQVPPQERGVATPEITIYESTGDASGLTVALSHWLVIVDGPTVHVSRTYEIGNLSMPPRTVIGDPGVLRFDLPDEAVAVEGSVNSGRLPLRQDPVETRDGRGKTMAHPIRPGTTSYMVDHELAYSGRIELSETLYHGATAVTAIVLPAEVEVEAVGLESLGRSERQGIAVLGFSAKDLAPGAKLLLRVAGQARAPRPPGVSAGGGAAAAAGDGEPGEVEPEAVRSGRKFVVIAVASLLLLIGLGIGLGKPAVPPPAAPLPSRPRPSPRADALLDEIAALDRAHEMGTLGAAGHASARGAARQALDEELRAARRQKKPA